MLASADPLQATRGCEQLAMQAVLTEMDVGSLPTSDGCFYPQISALAQLHKSHPAATWILTVRSVTRWVESAYHWAQSEMRLLDMKADLAACGAMVDEVLADAPNGSATRGQLHTFYTRHVTRVRHFVKQHPEQRLVELDIEHAGAGEV